MALEQEMATFARELPGLLRDPANMGKYALVHGDKVDSLWPDLDAALHAGYDRFGLDPFLVKPVVAHEEPRRFSRGVTRCQ
jgi:hypothetical protein